MMARAIIIEKNKILLIHRLKNGKEYFVLPGGHIEKKESAEEALVREVKEETNLEVQSCRKLWTLKNPLDNSEQHFFLTTEFSGEIQPGGPESERNSPANKYILEWHNLNDISKLNLAPASLKKKLIRLI